MKVIVLYRPNSEHGRSVEEFVTTFQSRVDSNHRLEVLSADSREGDALANLYGVMQYPAILVVQTDGYLQKNWEGGTLPLVDEVIAYSRA